MSLREKFSFGKIAKLRRKTPRLDDHKECNSPALIVEEERSELEDLEEKVLKKLLALVSEQNTEKVLSPWGPMLKFDGELVGDNGKNYNCVVLHVNMQYMQKLEIEVTDLPSTDSQIIRKYARSPGISEIDGKRETWNLSSLMDQPFSWRRNSSKRDYPEKALTIEQSREFMREILRAHPVPAQSSPFTRLIE